MTSVPAVLSAIAVGVQDPVTRVPIDHVVPDGRAWPRQRLDEPRAEMFAALLQDDPEAVPPLIVVDDHNGRVILADGRHRYRAHKLLGGGYEWVTVHVVQAPPGRAPSDFAYEVALECSATAAKPLTRGERMTAVDRLLAERPELPDRAIARLTGAAPSTVGIHRRALSDQTDVPEGDGEAGVAPRRPVDVRRVSERQVRVLYDLLGATRGQLGKVSHERAGRRLYEEIAAMYRDPVQIIGDLSRVAQAAHAEAVKHLGGDG